MAGVYLHIPFCKSRCIYCDFYSNSNESQIDAFVHALCAEAKMRRKEIKEPIKSIYFGGGTPSRLNKTHFQQLFETLFSLFSIENDAEITLEANPDDVSPEYIRMLSRLAFNRISIGIQSFNDDELTFLSRRHSAQEAINAVKNCQKAGFENISIDLMYGLSNQTSETWQNTLYQALALNVPHISAYHLIYEEKTRLYRMTKAGSVTPVSEDISTQMFEMLIDTLTANGYEHYEISNFARNKLYSQHNTSYWQDKKYIGLGPSAHSYDGKSRRWNVSSLRHYLDGIVRNEPVFESEELSSTQHYNERILTGLRTMWGVDLDKMTTDFGNEMYDYCMKCAQPHLYQQTLQINNNRLCLTRQGIFISDGIMSDLMKV